MHKLWTKIKQAVFFHRPGFRLLYACRGIGVDQSYFMIVRILQIICCINHTLFIERHLKSRGWLSNAKKGVIIFNPKINVLWMSYWFEVSWCSCLLVSLASSHVCEEPQGYTFSSAISGFYSFLAKSVALLSFDASVPFSQQQSGYFSSAHKFHEMLQALNCFSSNGKPSILSLDLTYKHSVIDLAGFTRQHVLGNCVKVQL